MRILEYNEFNSEEFPKIPDIQSCFYDITEDESISGYRGRHSDIELFGLKLGKDRKIIDYKDQLVSSNKYYIAGVLWNDCAHKLVFNKIDFNKIFQFCDYLVISVFTPIKPSLEYEPTFNKFKKILGDKDRFNQEYGKGEDLYSKTIKNFKQYDDDKNKNLFDIIDVLDGCIDRLEDMYPKWTPFNYLVGTKIEKDKGDVKETFDRIYYQGYYVFNSTEKENPLWDIIFRRQIENLKSGKEVIDGILD